MFSSIPYTQVIDQMRDVARRHNEEAKLLSEELGDAVKVRAVKALYRQQPSYVCYSARYLLSVSSIFLL